MKSPSKPVTAPKSQMAFKLKTLFMGSDGTVPEQYARTTENKNLNAWLAEGLIERRPSEKIYALTPKGEARIK
jgi:hypothetical protein